MQLYRLLTGPDDAAFCHRVSEALNRGWQLHGAPALTFNGKEVIAAQAIVKEAPGDYHSDIKLSQM
jgi:hypothetical protein